jgi:molybdate transport system regulatory protein
MASKKNINIRNFPFKYKIWLETSNGTGILGDGKIDFLKAIDKEGSIQAASRIKKISYRKAWDDLKNAEEMLGFPLVNKYRGGADGGSTCLTDECKALIKSYDELHKEFDKAFKKILSRK